MNTTRRKPLRRQTQHAAARRRGSVLVVVLALLSALMLLGFLFYTTASQERANARAFAASEKFYEPAPGNCFDPALEQIIIGPSNDLANSVLWGGRYSLLASLVGTDVVPYNGAGVNLVDSGLIAGNPANGVPVVDQDHDGASDAAIVDADSDGINDNLVLHMGQWVQNSGGTVLPLFHPLGTGVFSEPDVGYSYPDLNSPFLSYEGTEPMTGNPVILPSFHRPQYLRGLFGSSITQDLWYTNALTAPYTLRPHIDRPLLYFDPSTGQIVDTGANRFADEFWDDVDPMTADDPLKVNRDPKENFWDGTSDPNTGIAVTQYDVNADNDSFDVEGDGPDDGDGDGIGDGTKEAILLDLGLPVAETPDGSQQYLTLYGVTIRETDALFNLNAHGNLYNIPADLTQTPNNTATGSPFLSASNEGRHTHEVNPTYGLNAPASEATGGDPEPTFFGNAGPPTTVQLANIEFWFTMVGREETPGRWGEKNILAQAAGGPNAALYPRPGTSGQDDSSPLGDMFRGMLHNDLSERIFPAAVRFLAPGHPEDHLGLGSFVLAADGRTMSLAILMGGNRIKVPAYLNYWLPSPIDNGATTDQASRGPRWLVEQLGSMFGTPIVSIAANFGFRNAGGVLAKGFLIDNPGETILDPDQSNPDDSIFGPGETAALHMSDLDFSNSSMTSRLIDLVPANFKGQTSNGALARRQRFTTVSRDLKSYSLPTPIDPSSPRAWETRLGPAAPANNSGIFPPYFGAAGDIEVFRQEARAILQQSQSPLRGLNNANTIKGLVRKLSVNQVAAQAPPRVQQGSRPEYILRPLTPHPTVKTNPSGGTPIGAVPIPVPSYADADGVGGPDDGDGDGETDSPIFGVRDMQLTTNGLATWNITSVVDNFTSIGQVQEWHARRDRQNLARDIFTLLYLTSHFDPAINVTTTSNARPTPGIPNSRPIYTDLQLREMAQFAVNIVDAMDPDDTITVFVYDKDLLDGYTNSDDGYSVPLDAVNDFTDYTYDAASKAPVFYENEHRGMVFGVEAQQLAFNEVLAVLAKEYDDDNDDTTPAQDHEATLWKDTAHRDAMFLELQNMMPYEVTLNGGWSIVCQPIDTTGAATFPARSLTILSASGQDPNGNAYTNIAAPGETFTIGAAGDDHLNDNPPPYTPPQGSKYGSALRVDQDGSASAPPADFAGFNRIAPAATNPQGPLQFDAIDAAAGEVNVNQYDPARPWDDGDVVDETNLMVEPGMVAPHPVGSAWLNLGTQNINDTDTRDEITFGGVEIDFILRRRVNLHRDFPSQDNTNTDDKQQKDNPWVVVDRWENVPLRVFDPATTTPALPDKLHDLVSSKRFEPLDRDRILADDQRNISAYQSNSLGGYHTDDTTTPASIWQRHYDRSFASLADLLQVPLYAPRDLTDTVNTVAATDAGLLSLAAVKDPTAHALARFLFPDGEPRRVNVVASDGTPTATPVRTNGNLWYRLFGFVEVPDKYGNPDDLDTPFPWPYDFAGLAQWTGDEDRPPELRRYGKINLNMLRHPHVLGGLLDDPRIIDVVNPPNLFTGKNVLRAKDPAVTGILPTRDWWHSLLYSRDGGYDPIFGGGGSVILPGVPAANPFRSFSVGPATTVGVPPTDSQIQEAFSQTFLRSMVGDDMTGTFDPADKFRRSLFELGNTGSLLGGNADIATRYRLLGKVLKHGTTRSNTYVIFMTCDYYEAVPVDPSPVAEPVYQIGEKLAADPDNPEEPRFRGVFVVDRTLALQMLEKDDLPQKTRYPVSAYQTFSFAREQSSGGMPQPTFDWADLIIYKKILKEE